MPTDTTNPSQTCAACGCTSPLARLFRKAGTAGVLCPRCFVKHSTAQQRQFTILIALAFGGSALYALLTSRAGLKPPYALGNIFLGVIAVYVSIIGHELAHALAGWLTGGRVYEIRLGAGPDLFTRRLGELLLRVRRYLAGGICFVIYPPGRQQRWRAMILYAAGLLFHLLLIGLLLPGFPHENFFNRWAWRDMLFIANVLLLAIVLLPQQALTQDGLVMTDAAQLWQIATTPWDASARQATAYTVVARLAWQRGDLAAAVAAARAGAAVAPPQPWAMNLLGIALLELGRTAEARTIFETLATPELEAAMAPLLPDADSQALMQAMNRNNLAYTLLLEQAVGSDLQRALTLAEAAFTVAPWEASIEGTLGGALVETGQVEAGLRHLEAAGQHYDRPRAQASNLAWRAWGHHRLGQIEQAQALLQEATRLGDTQPSVALIRQKMQTTP